MMEAMMENPIDGMSEIPMDTTTNSSNGTADAEAAPAEGAAVATEVNTQEEDKMPELTQEVEDPVQEALRKVDFAKEITNFEDDADEAATPKTDTVASEPPPEITVTVSEASAESANIATIEEIENVEQEGETTTGSIDDGENAPIVEEPQEDDGGETTAPEETTSTEAKTAHDEMNIEEIQQEPEAHSELEEAVADTASNNQSETVESQAVLQIDENTANSAESEEAEMILEETTGEYVLASSLRKDDDEPDSPNTKKLKVELEDKTIVKVIEENFKAGDLQPGEQIVVLTSDEDGNTKEVVFTHTETTTENGVTIQHVVDESGEVFLIETVESAEEEEQEVEEAPQTTIKKSTRKLQIPNHVLGRNIINPAVDSFRNGKAPPKPRLGVKVPYRNLTSQIVSKQEIAEEIFERSRRFSRDNPRQNLFARKLTSTLAKKLTTGDKKSPAPAAGTRSKNAPRKTAVYSKVTPVAKKDSSKLDNSDLLAILEGDDAEPEAPKEVVAPPPIVKEEMSSDMEREIALKQLSELPEDLPQQKKKETKANEESKQLRPVKRPLNEPLKSRFSGNAPLKTYTRKRKPSDDLLQQINPTKPIVSKQESPNPEHATTKTPKSPPPSDSATNNYVTKSSRVIKRKVIWDPDEVTPKKGIKVENIKSDEKEKHVEIKKEHKAEVVKKVETTTKKTSPVITKITRLQKKAEEEKEKAPEEVEAPAAEEEEQEEDEEEEVEKVEKPSTPVKIKRRFNEVSKLLMDEGAVNMLYSIKNEDAPTTRRPNKSLQSKSDELLNDLVDTQTNKADKASPKALRKKEGVATPTPISKPSKKIMCPPTPSPISRQKSKDSNRSSVHSPPPSPGHAFGGSESRIIRRHSSSSYSSMGEEDDGDERKVKKAEGRGRRRAAIEHASVAGSVENQKKKFKPEPKQVRSKADIFEKLVEIKLNESEKYNKYQSFDVNELHKLVQIDLGVTTEDDNNVYITNEMMIELSTLLGDLEKDKNVNVVLITSNGPAFCNGINFKTLVVAKEAARKTAAKKLANNIKDFLLCLAKFPKVLVAGIHGDTVGIGVTMLPLFDMIIAEQQTTFTIPNAKLGCIAEGGSMLLLPHLSRNVLVNELLYSSQSLSAEEALKLGLATKILPTETFSKDLLSTVKGVSDKSAQFMVATKKQLRRRMISDIINSLNDETDNLVEQWISDECQKNFTEYFVAD